MQESLFSPDLSPGDDAQRALSISLIWRLLRRESRALWALLTLWFLGQLIVVVMFDRPWGLDAGADTSTYRMWAEKFPSLDGPQWGYVGFIMLVKISESLGLGLWLVFVLNFLATMAAARLLMQMAKIEYGPVAGWVASAGYLLHPMVCQWFKYVLTDALFTAGVVGTSWACWRIFRNPTNSSWFVFVGSLVVTSSLRPTGVVLIGAALTVVVLIRIRKRALKGVLATLVWLALGAVAVSSSIFSADSDSSGYSLMSRALSGEIVYGDSSRAMSMPSVNNGATSNLDYLRYVIENPWPNAKLILAKIGWELGQVRPWYSDSLNVYVGSFMVLFYVCIGLALTQKPQRSLLTGLLVLSVPFVFFIGITWAIWEGRFAWWFLAMWFVPFGGGVQRVIDHAHRSEFQGVRT